MFKKKDKAAELSRSEVPGSLPYVWKKIRTRRLAMAGLIFVAVLLVLSFISPWICPYSYKAISMKEKFALPSWEHPFGCDELGRDILSRVLYGAKFTMSVGVFSTGFSCIFGIVLGSIAGYFGGKVDGFIMRCLDVFQSFPGILLAITLSTVLGPGFEKVIIAMGIAYMPSYARMMRANILTIRSAEYIEAATAMNCSTLQIVTRHIIPNAISPLIVQIAMGIAGAGKTTIAKAIMQILPDHATKRTEGAIAFKGQDLMKMKEHELQHIRGSQISMVFQDPMTALNPVMTVGEQIAEGIRNHQGLDKAHAKQEAIKMLETVGISRDRIDEYPHQFSGGMKQRVVIAIALACNPELLIADEPTTALDVTIQAQVLDLIKALREKKGTSLILITHDLGVVADTCDKVAVVYAGEIVEVGSLEEVFDHPTHPYTKGLFGAIPDMYKDVARLSPIEGLPPNPTDLPEGCYFAARCPYATDACRAKHCQLEHMTGTHFVRCLNKEQEG